MTIHAIYEDGVFKPTEAVGLPDGAKVKVEVVGEADSPAVRWLLALKNRTPEEVERDREELRAISPPTQPLPPGKTLGDIWPGPIRGEETEEQVHDALERLS